MKRIVFLILIIVLCLTGCSTKSKEIEMGVLSSKYSDLRSNEDFYIGKNLGFKSVSYEGEDGFLLAYLDNVKNVDLSDIHYFSSSQEDKFFISIDSYFIKIEENVMRDKESILGILQKSKDKLAGDYSKNLSEQFEIPNPYIVSGNENCYYIDYLTRFSQDSNVLVYYHILIEDIRDVMSIDENVYEGLNDNLQELRDCLGVYDAFDYPKN